MKVLKPERRVLKRHGKEYSSVLMTEEMEDISSAEDLSLLAEEEKENKEIKVEIESNYPQNCLKDINMSNVSSHSPLPLNPISISTSISTSLSPADSEEYSADSVCTDTSDVTDRETEISVQQSPPSDNEVDEKNEKKKLGEFLTTPMELLTEVVTEVEEEAEMEAQDSNVYYSIKSDDKSNTLLSIPNQNQNQNQSQNQSLNHIMDPNEPVYMGSKKYEKLFIFWQVSKRNSSFSI